MLAFIVLFNVCCLLPACGFFLGLKVLFLSPKIAARNFGLESSDAAAAAAAAGVAATAAAAGGALITVDSGLAMGALAACKQLP